MLAYILLVYIGDQLNAPMWYWCIMGLSIGIKINAMLRQR